MSTPLDSTPQGKADKAAAHPPSDQGAGNVTAGANFNLQAEVAGINALAPKSRAKAINLDADIPDKSKPAGEVQYNHSGFVGSLVQNLEYQGVNQTTKAAAQIVDQIAGTSLADKVNLFAKPLPAEYKSAEWYGEQYGSGIGQIAPLLAAFAVTRGASAKLGITAALEGTAEREVLLSRTNMVLTGQATVAGFASSALFTANEGGKKDFVDFAGERLKNGAIGAVDMAAITAGTLGLKRLGTAVAADSPLLGAAFRNSAVGAAVTGYPTGMLSAQMQARLFENRSATLDEMQRSGLSMSTVGFGLGLVHGKATESAVDRAQNPTISDVVKDNFNRGYQHFDNFMASINPLLDNGPRLAYARAGASGLRGMAMESTLSDLRSNTLMMQSHDGLGTGSSGRRGGGLRGSDTSTLERTRTADESIEPKGKAKGTPLHEALRDLDLEEVADFVESNKTLKQQRVVGTLGQGYGNDSQAVLELAPSKAYPDGGALKVTIAEGGWQNRWGQRSFDAKLLSPAHPVELNGSGHAGEARVYVQELVDTKEHYEPQLVDDLFRRIGQSKLEFGDNGSDIMKQVGISRRNGRLVLIDYPAVDQEGTHETQRQITHGQALIEEEYEAENAAIKAGKNDQEKIDFEHVIDAASEGDKQAALRGGQFTPQEQELLTQLKEGIPKKEVLEFAALLQGKITPKGMPDVKAVQTQFDGMVKRAQAAGVLEKTGKGSKMNGSSDLHDGDGEDY